MSIGKMREKITLQKPDLINDGQGGRRKNPAGTGWADVASVFAEFLKPSVKTAEAKGTIVSEVMRKISIWKREDVQPGWRLKWKTKTYEIKHVYEYTPTITTLVCMEEVNT